MEEKVRKIKKLLIANRGEIAIRILRAASEMYIRTVAIYTYEDRYSLHRFKADESYLIGDKDEPLKPYLDIEGIIRLAKERGVDGIHPGYGFLSENATFAHRCREEGIVFVGPAPEVMEKLGDKIRCKEIAKACDVPIIENSEGSVDNLERALSEAERIGFPVMIKAVSGGGGRGMRVARNTNDLKKLFNEARDEAKNAFGNASVYLEKYIETPKHIEVQLVADNYGRIVHLFERDCSVQRRFQKVVEVAPSFNLSEKVKNQLYAYAIKLGKHAGYNNVGTVEFLLDKNNQIYFIEVNTRIQVEHTITEEVTGIDIVRTQILIAMGYGLDNKKIYLSEQEKIKCNGYAVQCRVTTENPEDDFKPDYGTIIEYRNGSGFGIRLDEGNIYSGIKISPYYDSMLVKVTAKGRTIIGSIRRLHRALREFRIRGVITNIGFLQNLIIHPDFIAGNTTVNFIQDNPQLFYSKLARDRANKRLYFIADIIVNGNEQVSNIIEDKVFEQPAVPAFDHYKPYPKGMRDVLKTLGREAFVQKILADKEIHFTDTTFRDAHQSLIATRVRSLDLLEVAESFARNAPEIFSMEVWGGATFDVCLRFLHECPWQRLKLLRERMPNMLLQMLLRGSNAVGYTSYPDNLIERFILEAAETGIDIFRIFDSLNWIEAMKLSIKTVVNKTDALAEGCICYTGNIIDPERKKYTLQYYVDLAKELQDLGIHMLAIKDMAGLLTPYAAQVLIEALKKELQIPIHLHTHDTSSMQSATYVKAIESGVDIVDCALSSFSGLTSQPNLNSLVHTFKQHERSSAIDVNTLNKFSNYWEVIREYYYPFESGLKAGNAHVYEHEIPGGQYSNLKAQAKSLGLGDKIEEIKKNYAIANKMLGDIIKVTPSSKVVGDFALFLTSNHLTEQDIYEKGHTLSFPESLKGILRGDLGQPVGGWPSALQQIVLKDEKPYTEKPNAFLEPIDFEKDYEAFKKQFENEQLSFQDFLSFKLYPKVFEDYYAHKEQYGDVSNIPTPVFYYGLKKGEEVIIPLQVGKNLIIRYDYMSEPNEKGFRELTFKLNGKTRQIAVRDKSIQVLDDTHKKAGPDNPKHIGSPLQGKISKMLVQAGDQVEYNAPLFVIEAMKMETTVNAGMSGTIKALELKEGTAVEQDDLVLVLE